MKSLIIAAKEDCDCIKISNQYIGQILSKIEPPQYEFIGFFKAFTKLFPDPKSVDLFNSTKTITDSQNKTIGTDPKIKQILM